MTERRGERGPVEDGPWPKELAARAVSLDASPRLFGYDVRGDLVPNYGFVEIAWLALTGALPRTRAHGAAVEVVLGHLSVVTALEAPAHAAGLSRLCGSATSSVVSIGALTLAEQARACVESHAPLWPWLRGEVEQRPALLDAGPEDEAAVRGLSARLEAVGHEGALRSLEGRPRLETACLGALFELGLEPERMVGMWVWCKLPCVMAEAFEVPQGRLRTYPMDLPRFEYEGRDE